MAETKFEWDENKRKTNLEKHKIDFLLASQIFKGPGLETVDDREDYGESRMIRIGEARGRVLVVIYVEQGQTIRIISARKAQAHDEKEFYRFLFGRN